MDQVRGLIQLVVKWMEICLTMVFEARVAEMPLDLGLYFSFVGDSIVKVEE